MANNQSFLIIIAYIAGNHDVNLCGSVIKRNYQINITTLVPEYRIRSIRITIKHVVITESASVGLSEIT
jgi:hypothetical protein